MHVENPTMRQVECMLHDLGLSHSEELAPEYWRALSPLIGALEIGEHLSETVAAPKYPRGGATDPLQTKIHSMPGRSRRGCRAHQAADFTAVLSRSRLR